MRFLPLLLALLLIAPPLGARGGRKRAPKAQTEKDGDLERILVEDPEGTVGFLYTPKSLPEGEEGGLVVFCHGHGGTPKGVIKRDLAERKKWLFLSCQGGSDLQTPQGPGHSWSSPDTERILALTRWTLANRPVDPKKVVLIGFSAGGRMVLSTWKKEPSLFSGIVTCSSPVTPDSGHDAVKVVVFLGTSDPNFSGASAVRNRFEKRKVGGSLQVVEGAGHNDLPETVYFDLALSWILEPKAAGHEVRLPQKPPAEADSTYRHILVAYSRAEGAPKSLRRKKSSAKSQAKRILKSLTSGRAWFPHEAQAFSDDRGTAPVGGAIDLASLKAYGGELEDLEAEIGKAKKGLAGPFESPSGFHLVLREPGE